MTYTNDQIMALVNERVPNFTTDQKIGLVATAQAIINDSKYVWLADKPMVAVKIAIARLGS